MERSATMERPATTKETQRVPGEHGQEYAPTPVPPERPCIPLPPGWTDDPYFKLNPFALAGATNLSGLPPQMGTLGRCTRAAEKIAVNYNDCFAHAYFAPPKFGKTYVRGVHIENATLQTPYLNVLPNQMCAVSFHYEQGQSHAPDLLESVRPNHDRKEVAALVHYYGSLPQPLSDILCFTLDGQVQGHRQRYPHVQTLAIAWVPWDLGIVGIKHLMGFSEDDETLYGAQFEEMMRTLPARFTTEDINNALATFPFQNKGIRRVLKKRFALALPYLDDQCPPMRSHIKPGRTIVIDIRDGWLSPKKAMRLFATLNYVLVMSGDREELPCNLLLCFDEVHKFCKHKEVGTQIEYFIRERRHLRVSVVVLSQDPMSVPRVILSLLDAVGVFRTDAQEWLDYLGRQIVAFKNKKVEEFTNLPAGQMILWAREWWEQSGGRELQGVLVQMSVRPRTSHHGGGTRTAVA